MGFLRKEFDNFVMDLDPKDKGISGVLYRNGKREQAFMKVMNESIKEGDTCIDLGANIGYATLHMSNKAGEEGKVYAIEPKRNLAVAVRYCHLKHLAVFTDFIDGEVLL